MHTYRINWKAYINIVLLYIIVIIIIIIRC